MIRHGVVIVPVAAKMIRGIVAKPSVFGAQKWLLFYLAPSNV